MTCYRVCILIKESDVYISSKLAVSKVASVVFEGTCSVDSAAMRATDMMVG